MRTNAARRNVRFERAEAIKKPVTSGLFMPYGQGERLIAVGNSA
jgi:hypothetical protein